MAAKLWRIIQRLNEAVREGCCIMCVCTSIVKRPAKELDSQLAMEPSGREFDEFPYLDAGVASLIPGRINSERAGEWSWGAFF